MPQDTDAPVLLLLGAATMTVRLGAPFQDPGTAALDARDANVARTVTRGLPALQQALAAAEDDPSSLGRASATGLHGPWVLLYTATDAAGNTSPAISRSVFIDASCPAGTRWCAESRACVDGTCLPAAVADLLSMDSPGQQREPYTPPVDKQPPVLTLADLPGDERMGNSSLPAGVSAVVYSRWTLGQGPFEDPGWAAADVVDGDLTDSVSRIGLLAVQAAVRAGTPTDGGDPWLVRYRVADSAGYEAQAVRVVSLVCPDGERPCSGAGGDRLCTVAGVCVSLPGASAREPEYEVPRLQLVGDPLVYVAQGAPYFRCAAKQPLQIPCDQVRRPRTSPTPTLVACLPHSCL